MKRLALIALFALPMVMTGCEKLGEATGPEMSKVRAAALVKVEGEVTDSSAYINGTADAPIVDDPTSAGYEIGWP